MADNFLDGARDFVRDTFCDTLTAGAGFLNYASSAAENIGLPGAIASVPSAVANGAVGLFCNRVPGPIPPTDPPPFSGGQCQGVQYRIEVAYDNFFRGVFSSRDTRILQNSFAGPIERVELEFSGLVSQFRVFHNGIDTGSDFEQTSNTEWRNGEVLRVFTADGSPDDCGDLPGTRPTDPPPGTDAPLPGDIVVGPPGSEVNIPVTIGFGPLEVSVDGSLNVGFNIVNPDFSLFGDLDLTTGDINFNFGGRKPDNEQCCLPPVIDDDDQPEEGEEDPPEDQRVIVGVLVNSVVDTALINSTLVPQENGPNFYNPRVANVYFGLRIKGQIFWTEPIAVKHENQYIQCPADFGASRVVANPVQGVTVRLSPIRRRIPSDELPT